MTDPLIVMDEKLSRLVQVREKLGLNPKQFADRLDINPSNYYQIEKGARKVGKNVSFKIVSVFGVNPEWWDTGEGEMFIRKPENNAKLLYDSEEMSDKPVILGRNGAEFQEIADGMYTMTVPLVTQPAYGGYLAGWWDPVYVDELPRHTIVVTKQHKGFYLAYTMRGDSMDYDGRDSISEGSIVTGRRVEKHHWASRLHFGTFPFYIIHNKEGIVVKQIIDHDVEAGTITLHSLNPDKEMYPDYKMRLSDVEQIFNVVQVTKMYKS